jgi:hypothetical protein
MRGLLAWLLDQADDVEDGGAHGAGDAEVRR